MSEVIDIGASEPDLTAAEYVLGVLDAAERQAAEHRLADPAFAREVDAWSERLIPLAGEIAPVAPPETVWRGVLRGVAEARPSVADGNVVELHLRRSVALWRGLTGAAAGLAAVLAVSLVWPRPAPPAAPAPEPMMTARLASPTGGRGMFVATMDPVRKELVIAPAAVASVKDRAPELWLIPTGGTPIPLGMVDFGKVMRVAASNAVGGDGRTTLAVSVEPMGGSPTGEPTGPVIAAGKLERL